MSRFICLEFDTDLTALFVQRPTAADIITTSDGETLKKAHLLKAQDGQTVLYSNDLIKKLAYTYNLNTTPMNMASLAASIGLTLSSNLSSSIQSKLYYWNHRKAIEIKSDMWYTVFTESGIMLVAPIRLSTSREVTEFNIVADKQNLFLNANISGESGMDISLAVDNTYVNPVTLDSELKSEALRKWKSNQRTMVIESGQDAAAMDWLSYDGLNFVVVSKKENSGRYIYHVVQEVNENYSFTGANITLTSNWGIIESGSNANGSFVKYADGTMECWISKSVYIAGGAWGVWGTAYINLVIATPWTYPATFYAAPVETCTIRCNGSTGSAAWIMGENINTTSASGRYYAVRAASVGNETWRVDVIAKGRWRA